MRNYANINEIMELLEESKKGEIEICFSQDNLASLSFFSKDGEIDVYYENGTITSFLEELLKHFNVMQDSP